jgi:hypothetical protein
MHTWKCKPETIVFWQVVFQRQRPFPPSELSHSWHPSITNRIRSEIQNPFHASIVAVAIKSLGIWKSVKNKRGESFSLSGSLPTWMHKVGGIPFGHSANIYPDFPSNQLISCLLILWTDNVNINGHVDLSWYNTGCVRSAAFVPVRRVFHHWLFGKTMIPQVHL